MLEMLLVCPVLSITLTRWKICWNCWANVEQATATHQAESFKILQSWTSCKCPNDDIDFQFSGSVTRSAFVTKLSLFWALRFSMLHADYLIVMFLFSTCCQRSIVAILWACEQKDSWLDFKEEVKLQDTFRLLRLFHRKDNLIKDRTP